MWSMFAACLAQSAGAWKVGRTATMSSSCSVTAARAAVVVQASRHGASGPYVVEVQLGNERHIEAELFAPPREPAHVVPARRHLLVGDVPEPSPEDRQPVAEAHGHSPSRSR